MPAHKAVRQTKIVCTIGPATASEDKLRALIQAGLDVARLNFSHGQPESHSRIIRTIRRLSQELDRPVGILQDLAGPKIRLGRIEEPERRIETGQEVLLGPDHSDPQVLPVDYPYLAEDVTLGEPILLADGLIELKVQARAGANLVCRVVVGGPVSTGKGVNLPGSRLRVQAFTAKDKADLALGLKEEVDFVALSFIRSVADLAPVHQIFSRLSSRPLLIAKIEKPQAVEALDQILAQVDGVMVARGDMGVEMPLEEVPLVQKRIIRLARRAGKPVITATQMLRSMVASPRPTRAEATDVANAVLDGTDALMLSEETAVGAYPIEAVAVLDRIARATEPLIKPFDYLAEERTEALPLTEAAITRAAVGLAQDLGAAAIVASTTSGSTARLVARFRPGRPIIGLTPEPRTLRQLTLSWGVRPALVESYQDTDQMLSLAGAWASGRGLAGPGDRLVVTAGLPIGVPGNTNLLKILELD